MVKQLNVNLDDEDYKKLVKAKGKQSGEWRSSRMAETGSSRSL